jgi:hypothetical protein
MHVSNCKKLQFTYQDRELVSFPFVYSICNVLNLLFLVSTTDTVVTTNESNVQSLVKCPDGYTCACDFFTKYNCQGTEI